MDGGAGGSLAFDGRLISRALCRGGAVEHAHGVEGEAVQDLDAAIMKRQSQT